MLLAEQSPASPDITTLAGRGHGLRAATASVTRIASVDVVAISFLYGAAVASGPVVGGGAGVGGIGTAVGFDPHGEIAPPKQGTYSGGIGGAANVGSVMRPS